MQFKLLPVLATVLAARGFASATALEGRQVDLNCNLSQVGTPCVSLLGCQGALVCDINCSVSILGLTVGLGVSRSR